MRCKDSLSIEWEDRFLLRETDCLNSISWYVKVSAVLV